MDKKKNEPFQDYARLLSLSIVAVIAAACLFPLPEWAMVYEGCPMVGRLCYSFFHTGGCHVLVNVWSLLLVVFLGGVGFWSVLAAYAAAVLIPIGLFPYPYCEPTCGLSVMVFFLLGSISYRVRRSIKYDLPIIIFILLGFVLPHVNAMAHAYAYVVGWVYGFLFTTRDGTGHS